MSYRELLEVLPVNPLGLELPRLGRDVVNITVHIGTHTYTHVRPPYFWIRLCPARDEADPVSLLERILAVAHRGVLD